MIRKFIAIRNVGRFHNSAVAGNPELSRHTFILGANDYGKTTICVVLRSLKNGRSLSYYRAQNAGRDRRARR